MSYDAGNTSASRPIWGSFDSPIEVDSPEGGGEVSEVARENLAKTNTGAQRELGEARASLIIPEEGLEEVHLEPEEGLKEVQSVAATADAVAAQANIRVESPEYIQFKNSMQEQLNSLKSLAEEAHVKLTNALKSLANVGDNIQKMADDFFTKFLQNLDELATKLATKSPKIVQFSTAIVKMINSVDDFMKDMSYDIEEWVDDIKNKVISDDIEDWVDDIKNAETLYQKFQAIFGPLLGKLESIVEKFQPVTG